MMLIEGDMVVPLDFYETLGARGVYEPKLWDHGGDRPGNGEVPYVFDGDVEGTQRLAMKAAMDEWAAVANVKFKLRDGEANYVRIHTSTTTNASHVGMIGGPQDIWIYNWGWKFIMAHELGHTLGLEHEHSRADRDNFIQIISENIKPGEHSNFSELTSPMYGDYDFDSVMHYGECAFTKCTECPFCPQCAKEGRTIEVLGPSAIGQRDHLSTGDAATMSYLYPPKELPEPTPTISGWGLMVLSLLMLTGMAVKFGRRSTATAPTKAA
jgi:hypothetical protein